MARISNTKWRELAENEGVLIETMIYLSSDKPNGARGYAPQLSEVKYLIYDALHEASMAWSCAFAKELREAVYEHRYNFARQMLEVKSGIAKDRALILIGILEAM